MMEILLHKNPKSRGVVFDRRVLSLNSKFQLGDKTRIQQITAICDGVIEILGTFFSVSTDDLRTQERGCLSVARVRQVAMYMTHIALNLSMKEVAFGFNKDRSTVMHACHVIEDLRDDPVFDQTCSWIETIVSAIFAPLNGKAPYDKQ